MRSANRAAASLDALWSRLAAVRSLAFDARSAAGTGWNGVAVGTVAVGRPRDDVLIFTESGAWTAVGSAKPIAFNNVFRWTRFAEHLRLEHLRHGVDRPVFLFDLAATDDGNWREARPHLCGDDVYRATLLLADTPANTGVDLAWTIDGPKKREAIDYAYRHAPPGDDLDRRLNLRAAD